MFMDVSNSDFFRNKFNQKNASEKAAKMLQLRAEMITRFGHAANRFARSGFATTPPEILADREATCRACPEWDASALNNTGRCRKCGCSTWAKLRMATEACPIGKWKAVSAAPEVARKPE
jgi:hypothetical protein